MGEPVKATDPDGDTLSYSLSGGADKDAFTIDQETGQIEVGSNPNLNFEGEQATYTVDRKSRRPVRPERHHCTVTITVTDVDEAPTLALRPRQHRAQVLGGHVRHRGGRERGGGGYGNIGGPVKATDDQGDALTYSLSGDDAPSLTIGGTSGQIRTNDALDYETKSRIATPSPLRPPNRPASATLPR